MEDILDSEFQNNVRNLSDFQLVGILAEKSRYPHRIGEKVKLEIDRRKLSTQELPLLLQDYQKNGLLPPESFELKNFVIFIVFVSVLLCILFSSIIIGLMKSMVIVISVFAVKKRKEKGIASEKRIWFVFQIVLISLLWLLLGVLIVK